ncbi:MAG: hypothetical protein JXD22_05805 [Sedimentisphaerales bacterium]|nr:hypothetical protein [Sedimentisphaerales bacterium]
MKGMTIIVKEVTTLVIGFILLYSINLILTGHLTPGGGFVGGVMLACGFILMVLSYGKEKVNSLISDRSTTVWDCSGAFAFLVIALLGYFAGDFFANFFAQPGNFRLFSGGTIPLANIAIGIKVGACMAGAFIALTLFRGPAESFPGGKL